MAGRPRKPLEERIAEKEKSISGLQKKLKAEQNELEALYSEKRIKDLEGLNSLIEASGLNADEVTEALHSYISLKQQDAS